MSWLPIIIITLISSPYLVIGKFRSDEDYCTKYGHEHTMCKPAPGAACGEKYQQYNFTDSEIMQILTFHNKIRNITAAGLETNTSAPLPPACSMCEMQWHEEVAAIAQRHTDHCVYGHDCKKCRDVLKKEFTYCGQNVGRTRFNFSPSKPAFKIFKNLIDSWYSKEVHLFGPKDIYPYKAGGYGHYTRIIWGKTCYIGCGASKYYDGTWYNYFVACNYCEGGNYLGQAVYDVPCKNSKKYSNLCLP